VTCQASGEFDVTLNPNELMKQSNPIRSIALAALGAALCALFVPCVSAGTITQISGNNYIAFDALTATLVPGTPETWGISNIVNSVGGTALYAKGTNDTAGSPHSFAQYQIQFRTAGTYSLYYRWKADETRTAGDNATANSAWLPNAFGAYSTPGDQSPFYRADSNNQTAPADNAFAWRKEPTVTYTVGATELAEPVTFTIGTREAGMILDRIVFSTDATLTDVQLDSLTYNLSQIVQGSTDTFAAFSADGPVTILAGKPETWVSSNIVNSVGGTALYAAGTNDTAGSPHSFAQYQVVFKTAGTYNLYYRWKADETRTAGDNATANSAWLPNTFGDYETPGDQTPFYRSDSNNQTAPADNTFAWRKEPTATYTVGATELAGPVLFSVGTREAGMTLDRLVFSTDGTLTDVQLDSLADSGTQPPAPEIVSITGSETLQDATLVFSRPLAVSSVSSGDFTITPALGVSAAAVDTTDGRIVRLTTGAQTQGTVYTVAVTGITDTSGTPSKAGAKGTFTAWKEVTGWAKQEVYLNVTGSTVADLASDPNYPGRPDRVQFVRGFQFPISGTLTDMGLRLSALFKPASSGAYDFFVNNDDEAELLLSNNTSEAGLNSLGVLPLHAPPFGTDGVVTSPALSAGSKYLLRGVLKQGPGDAYLQVAAAPSGSVSDPSTLQVLSGNLISAFVNPDLSVVTFTTQPADQTAAVGGRARFTTKVSTLSTPVYYQWQKNGQDIPGATRDIYTTPVITTSGTTDNYQLIVTVAGFSTPSRQAKLTTTAGQPSNIQPYIGVNFIGAGYVSDDAVSLAPTDVAGVQLQENWNNLGAGSDPVQLNDASGASSPVTLTVSTPSAATLGLWSSGTRSFGDPDGDLMQGFIHNTTKVEPVNFALTGVPAGNYQLIAYTMGFDFQADLEEAFSVAGAGNYPTYHALGETGLDYSQNPGYRRVTNTVATVHQKGNYVQFDNVSPAADGSLTLSVLWEAPTGATGSYNPAVNGFQLVKVLPVTARPSLAAAPGPGALVLSWDATAAGFVVESSSALGPTASWTTVTSAPNPISTAGSVTIPTSGTRAFYRLKK
jgi:hypothetical protein